MNLYHVTDNIMYLIVILFLGFFGVQFRRRCRWHFDALLLWSRTGLSEPDRDRGVYIYTVIWTPYSACGNISPQYLRTWSRDHTSLGAAAHYESKSKTTQ